MAIIFKLLYYVPSDLVTVRNYYICLPYNSIMVLEAIIPVRTAERRPIEMLPLAFLYSTLALFIALWIFPNHASLVVVFFTVMALLPLMVHMIRFEEKTIFNSELQKLESHHKRVLPFFIYMFIGIVLSLTLWFVFLPQALVQQLFAVQLSTIMSINQNINQVVAHAVSPSNYFVAIIANNLKVLIFVLLFSFIYGAGAIFILTWNASVVAVAIGNAVRSVLASYAGATGMIGAAAYFHAFSIGLLRYMVHGIPEIAAYFIGGLAGGLISVAILRHQFMDDRFRLVMRDSLNLIGLSVGMLLIAALIEVFISPLVPV